MDELECWLRLWHIPKVGPKTFNFLLSKFPKLCQLFQATYDELIAQEIPGHIAKAILGSESQQYIADIEWLHSSEAHHIILSIHRNYPRLLHHITLPPPILYACGDINKLNQSPSLAIVGSRKASLYAEKITHEFARHLADFGVNVVSGLARGVDMQAHLGALNSELQLTTAVLANGLDTIYPSDHKKLAHRITQQGVIISEFPPKVAPLPQHFPRRNRIISGLSLGTLVIEAAQKSGSLITANYALEQNREVFAVPGPINNPQNNGCHTLIQRGAKLTTCVEDIITELAPMTEHVSLHQPKICTNSNLPFQEELNCLLNFIDYTPVSVDSIIAKSGLTPEQVSSMLTELELGGHVVADAFGQYCRV